MLEGLIADVEALVWRDWRLKYRRAFGGFLWNIAHPIFYFGLYYLIFSSIFKNSVPNYVEYLLVGLVVWRFFGLGLQNMLYAVRGETTLIQSMPLHKLAVPVSKAVLGFMEGFVEFLTFIVFGILFLQLKLNIGLLLVIPLILLAYAITFGLGLVFCTMSVFFDDTFYLSNIFQQVMFFLTPVFYSLDSMSGKIASVVWLNPFTQIMYLARALLIEGVMPPLALNSILYAGGTAIGMLLFGYAVYMRFEKKFFEEL